MGASRHGVGLGPAWVGGVGEWVSRLGRRWSGLELVGGDWRAGCGESTPPGPAPSHTGVLPGRAKAAGGSCCSLGLGEGRLGPTQPTHQPSPRPAPSPQPLPWGWGSMARGPGWFPMHPPTLCTPLSCLTCTPTSNSYQGGCLPASHQGCSCQTQPCCRAPGTDPGEAPWPRLRF